MKKVNVEKTKQVRGGYFNVLLVLGAGMLGFGVTSLGCGVQHSAS